MPAARIDELIGDSQFQNVIDDPASLSPAGVSRVIFCSGKVFFSLAHARDTQRDANGKSNPREIKIGDTAIVRVEQPYPFPRARNQQHPGQVPQRPAGPVGAGRTPQPRLLDLHGIAPARSAAHRFHTDLLRQRRSRQPRDRQSQMHEVEEEELLEHALELSSRKPAVAATITATTAAANAEVPVAK